MLLFAALFGLQSCADDFADLTTENFQENGQRPGGGQGQGGNNNNGNNDDAEVAIAWQDLFLELDRYAPGMRPNSTARAIAYINLAAYEAALPGLRGYVSNETILDGLDIDNSRSSGRGIDTELALNTAYALAMDHFLINLEGFRRAQIAELQDELEEDLTRRMSNQQIEESKEWGEYVAQQVIAYSQTDLEAEAQIIDPQPTSYVPPTGPGYWTFSAEPERALFPYWESVRTFIVPAESTTTIAPISYSTQEGSDYYNEMLEVYEANDHAKETQDESLWIAEFWSDDVESIMFSPPARQISIANQLVEERRMDLDEALHLFLKVGFALNDAAVSCWKYKYEHMVMRPSVYIQDHIDSDYQTNLYRLIPWPNPTFPSYPSGHSTFASAAGGVFIDFFGNDIDFTDRSHEGRTEFLGEPRTYNKVTEFIDENAYSRLPLGVHMRIDCTEGVRLGYEIADGVNNYRLKLPTS